VLPTEEKEDCAHLCFILTPNLRIFVTLNTKLRYTIYELCNKEGIGKIKKRFIKVGGRK